MSAMKFMYAQLFETTPLLPEEALKEGFSAIKEKDDAVTKATFTLEKEFKADVAETLITEMAYLSASPSAVRLYVKKNKELRAKYAELNFDFKKNAETIRKQQESLKVMLMLLGNDSISVNSNSKHDITLAENILIRAKTIYMDHTLLNSLQKEYDYFCRTENGKLQRILSIPNHPNRDEAKKVMLRYYDIIEERMNDAKSEIDNAIRDSVSEYIYERRATLNI